MAASTRFVRAAWKSFLENGGHDAQCLSQMKITHAVPGHVKASLVVDKIHTNRMGTLHGGCILTIIDSLGSLALSTRGLWQTGVSVDIHSTFVRGAPLGTRLELVGSVINSGRTLAFTEVHLRDAATGKLVAQGTHTKYIAGAIAKKHPSDMEFSEDGEEIVTK